jgi:hypothetical protein
MKRIGAVGVFLLLLMAPVRGQEVVVDPTNLVETILIAERTAREYATLLEQYETLVRMARGLGSLDRYRIPTIGITGHDVARWPFAAPWLQGLNTGDPYGGLYEQTARVLERPGVVLNDLPLPARRAIENAYATIELTDSVAVVGGNQVALIRGYSQQLQDVMATLQSDVLNPSTDYHQVTAVLDKVAAGELIGRRQDMATNQLLSHALEQLLIRGKRTRDTEAATMNMRLLGMRDGRAAGASLAQGTADDLRTWRQP